MTESKRGEYLGSTDIASICGCGFQTPLELYMERTGLRPPQEPTEAMEAGLFLEGGVRKMMEKRLKVQIFSATQFCHWQHPEYPMLAGTDDGAVFKDPVNENSEVDTGAEIKLVGPHLAREFGDADDDLPDRYLLQTQWNMLTGRRKRFIVGAFFMVEMELRIFRIDRDEELCEQLLKRALHFWNENIVKKVPPKEDDPRIVKEYLARRYPTHSADMLDADEEIRKLGYKLAHVRHECKRLDMERDELENTLRAVIGGDEGINFDKDNLCTWRKAKDSKKIDYVSGFAQLAQLVDEKVVDEIRNKVTSTVQGSRRLLVKGPIFDSDPTVADMRGKLVE